MSAHTPTPWELGAGNLVVNVSDGLPVADAFTLGDAKRIIVCGNAHDALVAVIEAVCDYFDNNPEAESITLRDRLDAALAKVQS
jgi:hypothetical protein